MPTHLGVATDHVIESLRNDLWPEYKTGEGIDPGGSESVRAGGSAGGVDRSYMGPYVGTRHGCVGAGGQLAMPAGGPATTRSPGTRHRS